MRKVVVFLMLVIATVLVVLAISTVVIIREFVIRSEVRAEIDGLPTTAVVFTGQFDRIELALDLFDQGRLDRILISGVNGGAGISPERFAEQFRLSSGARAALEAGQIVLAPEANTTIENALETACWLDRQSGVHEIVLITDRFHMPRASWALESALKGHVVIRRLSPQTPRGLQAAQPPHPQGVGDVDLSSNIFEHRPELLRFAATVPLALIPRHLWPGDHPRACM